MAALRTDPAQPARRRSRWAAAIDIGYSKVVAAIGEIDPAGDLLLRGLGSQSPVRGARGAPADFDAVVRALRIALDEAERMSGLPIDTAVAAYGGPGVRSTRASGEIKLLRGVVDAADVKTALAAAAEAACGPSREALHVAPIAYYIDDGAPLPDPRGAQGKRLSADVLVVTAPAGAAQGTMELAREAGLRLTRVVAAPYAAGLGALSPEDRDFGALLLDIGAASTGLSAFRGGGLVHCETLALGGVRLTEHLAAHLGTSFAAADRLKSAYGSEEAGLASGVRIEAPRLGPEGRLAPAALEAGALQEILAGPLGELLNRAAARAAAAGLGMEVAPKVFLTGGSARLRGGETLAARAFGRPAELAAVDGLEISPQAAAAPAFAVAAGLLRWALGRPSEAAVSAVKRSIASHAAPGRSSRRPPAEGAMGKALLWLRENL